jgi:hypothetical protein
MSIWIEEYEKVLNKLEEIKEENNQKEEINKKDSK